MQKIFTLFFFLHFLFFTPFSSQTVLQSRKAFYSMGEDRLKHAEILRDFYTDESPDSLYSIGSFLIRSGIKAENMAWLNYGKLIISAYYCTHGKAEISLENLKDCRNYYESKRDLEKLADAQNTTGLALLYQLKNKEAIHWFLKSLQTAQQLPEESESYMAQMNLAEAFYRLEDFASAEKEMQSFIARVKRRQLNKGLRKAYDMMGRICFATERVEEGVDFYRRSLHLAYKNGDKLGLSFAKNNMAIAYFQLGEEEKAKKAFEEGLRLRKEINNPATICESYFNLGEYAFYKENYPLAIAYYDSCVKLSAANELPAEQADALLRIAECYKLSGDFDQAYAFMEKHALVQQEVLSKTKKDAYLLSEDLEVFRTGEEELWQRIRERTLEERIRKAEFNVRLLFAVTLAVCLFSAFYAVGTKRKRADKKNTGKEPFSEKPE